MKGSRAILSTMRTRPFGPAGEPVAVIGQGTWDIDDPDRAAGALLRGLELGMTHIDTAEMYTGAEATVARALARFDGDRSDVFVASKVLPRNASYDDTRKACRASRERLDLETLDLYLLHWWSDRHPIQETMRAFDDLIDEGHVRHAGVSNLDVDQLQAARDALDHDVVCDQVPYHLRDRHVEDELIPYCRDQGIAVVAYSPFGKDRGGFPEPGTDRRAVLDAIADDHGATARQVALAWVTREPHVFTIPKAEQVDHVEDNAGAADLELTGEDLDRIDEAFPR